MVNRKLYYPCPIVALYMAKYFEVKVFGVNEHHDDYPFENMLCTNKPNGVTYGHVPNALPEFDKFYIHPDSISIFKPMIGDVVLDEDAINGIRIEIPLQLNSCADSEIIMRGNLEFFMPCEEL